MLALRRKYTTNMAAFHHSLALSCLVLSCLILSYLVLSRLVLSCLVSYCLVLSCLVLSCFVLSYLVWSSPVSPCLLLSCEFAGRVLPRIEFAGDACCVLCCNILTQTVSGTATLGHIDGTKGFGLVRVDSGWFGFLFLSSCIVYSLYLYVIYCDYLLYRIFSSVVFLSAYCVLRTAYCVLRTAYCIARGTWYVVRGA
jgi:hypothetical protein